MEFDPFSIFVKDLSTRNVIIRCDSSGPLYTMRLPLRSTPSSSFATPTTLVASASTWHCQLGRHTRIPFVSSASRVDNNFDLIHCDLWTSPIVSISGCKYYLVILDDHSHFM
jgi:hypothetical protein